MEQVNLYIKTSNKGPGKVKGTGCYVLECFRNGEPKTIEGLVQYEATAMHAELFTALAALRRLNTGCNLTIWQAGWLQRAVEGHWLEHWEDNGWLASRGVPVKHKDEWVELAERININDCSFRMDEHSYAEWMETQIKKGLEKNV